MFLLSEWNCFSLYTKLSRSSFQERLIFISGYGLSSVVMLTCDAGHMTRGGCRWIDHTPCHEIYQLTNWFRKVFVDDPYIPGLSKRLSIGWNGVQVRTGLCDLSLPPGVHYLGGGEKPSLGCWQMMSFKPTIGQNHEQCFQQMQIMTSGWWFIKTNFR